MVNSVLQVCILVKTHIYMFLPEVPFSTDIRTNPKMNIKAGLLGYFNKPDQIKPPFKIVLKNPIEKHIKTKHNQLLHFM